MAPHAQPIHRSPCATPVVTRFAPSPTGYLHIGGARTALFNWLYARHTGGKMLLRIEDTDRERSTDAAIAAILDGLSWLGLDWDGEPIHQFARAARHREVAEELVARGKAYRAYETRGGAERDARQGARRGPLRRAMTAAGATATRPRRRPASRRSIRIKAPLDGETVIEDRVQGRVAFPNEDLDDFVILRSDGTPTYMLAVVVDDHDMGVTHIIRGDDHLTNAGRQKILYDAIGWAVPVMAHIPLIHGPDGAKLSKRHGALGVDAYRAMGYLPEAMRNYLVRLGWSHGDDEIMSTEQMIAWFDIDGIDRVGGALRLRQAREPQRPLHPRDGRRPRCSALLMAALPHLAGRARRSPAQLDAGRAGAARAALPLLKERAKTLDRPDRRGATSSSPSGRSTLDAAASGAARRRGARSRSAALRGARRASPTGRRRRSRRR